MYEACKNECVNWPKLPNVTSDFEVRAGQIVWLSIQTTTDTRLQLWANFSKFPASYLLAYILSEGDWHFHGSLCSLGFPKHFTHPWARCTTGSHHPYINLEKKSSHNSWIAKLSTQVKHSAEVTMVNLHVVRNMILDTDTCNQQLCVQNCLGWNNIHMVLFSCFSSPCRALHVVFSLSIVTGN